ncbi:MAG: polysaccharide biosynthesis tyrosine autokinase, partial [Magnetococcales bacterium]|nr:polysaccharide biosynthesis tyrosine autokinase [Magnetococcales bacterium]
AVPPLPAPRPFWNQRESFKPGRIYRLLWQRRGLILGAMLIATLLTGLWVMQVTRIYTAEAMVMVESPRMSILNIKEVMSQITPSHFRLLSEVEVIRSRNLIERVVEKLELEKDPLFNPALLPPKTGFGLKALIPDYLRALWSPAPSPDDSGEDEAARLRRSVINQVMGRLTVRPVTQSMVIGIQFGSPDAKTAARLANAIAEQYIVDQLESKFEATRRASTWLNQRLEGLRHNVSESEKAVEAYRTQAGLLEKQGDHVNQQQLSELNTQLILAQAQRVETEEKLKRFRESGGGSGQRALDESANSSLVQHLRQQEAELNKSITELSERYGEKHPKMVALRNQLSELRGKIHAEAASLSSGLEGKVEVARARERSLRMNLDNLQKNILDQGQSKIRLRELEREAEANRLLYENFLGRFKETSEQVHIQTPDARVIATADPPRRPSHPQVTLILTAAAGAGALLGIFLIFLLEQLDNVYRSQEQLEEESGVPAIGMVPLVIPEARRPALPADYLVERPSSAYAEALRSLWITLKLSDPDHPPRVIVVTSSLPEEGKTQLSMSLARTAASLGVNTVLVDCDLRRPMVRSMTPTAPGRTITDHLAGTCTLEEALLADVVPRLSLLPARPLDHPPLELLGSQSMERLIGRLTQSFDLVVIDSPPVMPVSDVKLLARMADRTLFCVKWDSTPREVVKQALRLLQESRVALAGCVLTQVNVKKHARYGYGDSGSYYGRYRKYYTN